MFGEIGNIGKLFPDTSIKLVIDVCRALQLHDLVELLEKAAKPRTLRPALPLKEIAKLRSDSKRPTTFCTEVKIVFVDDGETSETIGNAFKKICPRSKISRSKPDVDLSQFKRSFSLDMDRQNIVRKLREMEERERGWYDLKAEREKRKRKIEKELLQMSGDLQAKKKQIERDIFSAFDKSWGKGRGNIFISYFCVYFDLLYNV